MPLRSPATMAAVIPASSGGKTALILATTRPRKSDAAFSSTAVNGGSFEHSTGSARDAA